MNTASVMDLRKRAKEAVDMADEATLKKILAILEPDAAPVSDENDYVYKIEERILEYERGTIEPVTIAHLEETARKFHADCKLKK